MIIVFSALYFLISNLYCDKKKSVDVPDSLKRDFAILQKYAGSYKDENVFGFVNEFIFAQGYQGFIDVIGIYFTNSFQTGLGIVTDRLTPFPPTFKFSNSDLAKKRDY